MHLYKHCDYLPLLAKITYSYASESCKDPILDSIQGGGGGSLPGENFDGDNFDRGKISPPPRILRLVVIY